MTKFLFKLILPLIVVSSTYSYANTIYAPNDLAKLMRSFEQQYDHSKLSHKPRATLQDVIKLPQSVNKEWLLLRQIKSLRYVKPTADIKSQLALLSDYQSHTKTWLLDGNYKIEVIAWPIAAQAKSVLSLWEIDEAERTARQNLTSGNWQLVLNSHNRNQQAGYIKAIQSTQVELLTPLINHLLSVPQTNHYQHRLIWEIAIISKQLSHYKHAFDVANSNSAIAILKQGFAINSLTSSEQIAVLISAVKNPHLSSAALLQLSKFIDTESRVATLMINALSDPKLGGSAARALVRSNSFSVQQQLELLSQNTSKLEGLRARQVLRLKLQTQGGLNHEQ